MKYLYVDNLAYPYALQSVYAAKGQWPEGKGVDIDEVIFREYIYDTPPEGKYRCVGEDGLPEWADIPPPTREEQIASAETKKQQLINQANEYINSKQWPGKASIGRLKGEELAQYNLWLDYLDALELVDTSGAPDIEWPTPPAVQAR
ncbi:TPA: tail fiber assembly protein [Escherichia coli]|uniref:tail fiber assembly protein n=1 Tax=Escherichia coli TaxID=562 RepID=UPI00147BF177|nr:tail fiber assembly protein [Escherichia coli]MCN2481217.1 tail fiber assembly protein [Escherichia coli]MCN3358876.1 tail fiber assembly protein [Escherichia coli]MCN7029198.1 tail fiber assembly protein [Escherichia coli]HAJ3641748.1 tail fiber assembly protein [Escherichia coli]HAO7427192.1 tail fiber assembly protein [Escherichia coli]